MEMKKEDFLNVVKQYPTLVLLEDDVFAAFDLVADLLETEFASLSKSASYATNSLRRLEIAIREVRDLGYDISNAEFARNLNNRA